jgi:hypothetical protein
VHFTVALVRKMSMVVQIQGLSADKLHSDTTFEYVVLVLTAMQMFATYGVYPASSGIPVSLFALVALGINRFVQLFESLASSHSFQHHVLQAAFLEVVLFPLHIRHRF